jgi:hypothetical protein
VIVPARLRRLLPFLLAFALGIGAAAGLAACGGGGGSSKALIPASNADQLKSDLDDVSAAVDNQECSKADTALAQLQRDIQQLPAATSNRLSRKLTEGYDRLRRQADKECQPTTTSTQTVPTTTTIVPTNTVTTTTTPTTTTTTTPTTTTPTTTTPTTTETIAPDNGGVTTP